MYLACLIKIRHGQGRSTQITLLCLGSFIFNNLAQRHDHVWHIHKCGERKFWQPGVGGETSLLLFIKSVQPGGRSTKLFLGLVISGAPSLVKVVSHTRLGRWRGRKNSPVTYSPQTVLGRWKLYQVAFGLEQLEGSFFLRPWNVLASQVCPSSQQEHRLAGLD